MLSKEYRFVVVYSLLPHFYLHNKANYSNEMFSILMAWRLSDFLCRLTMLTS